MDRYSTPPPALVGRLCGICRAEIEPTDPVVVDEDEQPRVEHEACRS